ncbi:response regulator transcription factor [Pseudidiomarina insulisalsae]|uniref:DNA-binding response regulator n=1 Tax=Pseudidiomarina insulisalsae TaxID=575789 RepID=A0A432YQF1_9GAMM|nr:response regulator transcription factor [Pseudidiomarina insulisalsae]RUO63544.1 DNA-binding response regulator [Pseudidiomarina insulisalsae]
MSIKVILVDDQNLVRQGLQSLLALAPEVDVVALAANGNEALEQVAEYVPDVVLMDIRMPECDGIQAVTKLQQRYPGIPVLMLTTFDDHTSIMAAIKAGAKGYLLKDVSLETLVAAIECLHQGGTWLEPTLTHRIVEGLQSGSKSGTEELTEPLTDKELAVLRLLAAGLSNQEIAECLFKSTGTVKNQVSTILAKLGVSDRTRAVLKAIELGLLSASDNR